MATAINRRDFLFFGKGWKQTAELSGERLYMRYVDSTLNGTTSEFFRDIEDRLSAVASLRLSNEAWLDCDELKPVRGSVGVKSDPRVLRGLARRIKDRVRRRGCAAEIV